MRPTLGRIVAAVCVLAGAMGASYAAGAQQGGKPVSIPFETMKWEPYSSGSPLMVAPLYGDRTKSFEFGMLLKLPSGYQSGRHSHTADVRAVVIQGTWTLTND